MSCNIWMCLAIARSLARIKNTSWWREIGQKVMLVPSWNSSVPAFVPLPNSRCNVMRSTLLTGVLWFPAQPYKEHQPLSHYPTADVTFEKHTANWSSLVISSTALQGTAHVTSTLRSLGLQCNFQNVSIALSRQNFSTIPELSQEVNRCRGVCTQCHLRVCVCVWERERERERKVGWGMLVFNLCILCVFDVTCFACFWNVHTQDCYYLL